MSEPTRPAPGAPVLTDTERAIVLRLLHAHRGELGKALVFGSRATGRARPSSDIDLALVGVKNPATVDRLRTDFEESLLAVTVDLVDYDRLANPRLRAHIDAVGIELEPAPG